MLKLKAEVRNISDTDATEELKRELEIERKIEQHRDKVQVVKEELEIEIKVKGELAPEQQALFDSIVANLDGQSGEVEIEIENEKGETKIKVEQETGRSGDEVENELRNVLGIIDEEEREDALEEITYAFDDLERLSAEDEEAGMTLPEAVVAEISNLLEQAQDAFAAGSFEQAKELAELADDLVDDLEDQIEDLTEESDVEEDEVDTEDGDEDEVDTEDGDEDEADTEDGDEDE